MRCLKGVFCSIAFFVILFLTGCTADIRPTVSQSEFLGNNAKVHAGIALFITDDFKNYSASHFDWWCDATKYKMEIGPFATDWLRYSLESKFDDVKLLSGNPKFPYSDSSINFVVTPKFTTFKAGGPVLVKLEKYWIELGMDVSIQDREGKILKTLKLKEKGAQAGTIGVNPGVHLFPNICRLAMKPLADKTIAKLVELSNKKEEPVNATIDIKPQQADSENIQLPKEQTSSVLKCGNCGKEIGENKGAFVYKGQIVCSDCYAKLKNQP
jgi:hypothetical protein